MKKIWLLVLTVCLAVLFHQSTLFADALDRDIELLKSDDSEIREKAAKRLKNYSDKKAVDALSEAIHDLDEDVAEEALKSLGKIGDPKAIDSIVPLLSHDDLGIRRSAVRALKRIGDPKAIPALEKMLEENKNPFIERPIEAAIESLKAPEAQ